jgi:hypothetical protein
VHRIVAGQCGRNQGMARLVVGRDQLLVIVHHPGPLLRPGDDAVDRLVEGIVVDERPRQCGP